MRLRHRIQERIYRKMSRVDLTRMTYLPRYMVVGIDILLLSFALIVSLLALRAINVDFSPMLPLMTTLAIILAVNVLFFFIYKTYAGLIRHSSFVDILKLTVASLSTMVSLTAIHYLSYFTIGEKPFVIIGILLYTVLSFTVLLVFRVLVKQIFHSYRETIQGKIKPRIAILGVDEHSISLGQVLTSEVNQPYNVVTYLTRKPFNKYIRISGRPVHSARPSLKDAIEKLSLEGIMIIGQTLSVKEKNEIVNECLALGVQVFNAPLVEKWDSSKGISQQIKSIEIEELLDRDPIQLDEKEINNDLFEKVVLISGAAGSIGSELVRQISKYKPKKLVLVDQAETPLYALELELQEKFPDLNYKMILGDISNKHRMETLFQKHSFSIVYHAAAYKHVPMIEKNPREAISVNVLGTINLAELSREYKVSKFVMVSTDKAVNPTNVMGASKRAAEMYVQSLQQVKGHSTQFITTRFGNVLGSNGSVIPHFRDQIAKGGPLTVTHKDITRYFMTIPEACQLVLQAGTMGHGGEIFVFDMGEPVKIIDLAHRMIKLSGLQPFKDIDIKIVGLRPGEKLYEELLNDSSKTLPTHNKKILIAKDQPLPFELVNDKSKTLIRAAIRTKDKKEAVRLLKNLVPEFKSKNSHFEELDEQGEVVESPKVNIPELNKPVR